MKSILVIDMPKSCWACPLWDKSDYADGCEAVGRKTHDIDHGAEREVWCPLKPLPKRNEYRADTKHEDMDKYSTGYADGWNDCLEEITDE